MSAAAQVSLFLTISLAPLHIEVLSEDPRIVMFHDFLTEREMVTLKQMTLAELEVKYVLTHPPRTV